MEPPLIPGSVTTGAAVEKRRTSRSRRRRALPGGLGTFASAAYDHLAVPSRRGAVHHRLGEGRRADMANDVDVVARFERPARFWDLFDWSDGWFGGRRPWFAGDELLRIEEQQTDDSIVVRAELPG